MKIEVKDVKKHLSLKSKLIVTGKYSISVAKNFFEKYKKSCIKTINNAREKISESISNIKYSITPSEETVQETINEKLSSLNTKRNELKKLIENMEEIDEYKIGLRNCYLKETQKELEHLDKKIINTKEIEGKNRMIKTRGLFKKTGDIKGKFPSRMGPKKG